MNDGSVYLFHPIVVSVLLLLLGIPSSNVTRYLHVHDVPSCQVISVTGKLRYNVGHRCLHPIGVGSHREMQYGLVIYEKIY